MTTRIPTQTSDHSSGFVLMLAATFLCAGLREKLPAQAPCPGVEVFATGLEAPSKLIHSPLGNFIVAEGGPEIANHGRVSIVDQAGGRRTLIEGLPSARTFVGDFNGTTGVWLEGRTLYVLNGQGDVTVAGPSPGTESANPSPASPIFSSVLAVQFSAAVEKFTTGVELTLADHHALKSGQRLVRSDAQGRKIEIALVADFPDYLTEPRPNHPGNVRHSHPYGVVGRGRSLYIVDAGFNTVRQLDIKSGAYQTLTAFVPTPNPLPGPPFIENVPTSIRWNGKQLAVTLLSGGPNFLAGYSQVREVDPGSGAISPLIGGLSLAIDSAPLEGNGLPGSFLTLEFNLTFPVPGPGRILYHPAAGGTPQVVVGCLTTPTSMVLDRKAQRLVISELNTGRLVALNLE